MESEPPNTPPRDPAERQPDDKVVEFPLNERMRSRQNHPAGKFGRKPVEQTLREIGATEADDDLDPA